MGNELLFKIIPEEPGSCLPILDDSSISLTDYFGETKASTLLKTCISDKSLLVKYDPAEVPRGRITLTDPRPVIERHPWTNWDRPFFRLRLQQTAFNGGEYSVGQSVPERKGDYILPLPDSRLIAIIYCHSPSLESFVLTWGFTPTYPFGPWCYVWTTSEINVPAVQSALGPGNNHFDILGERIEQEDTAVQKLLYPSYEKISKIHTSTLGLEKTECESGDIYHHFS